MGLNIFKRKEAPKELPDLATDKLENKELEKDKELVSSYLKEKEPVKATEEKPEEAEDTYFNKLQEDIKTEINNLNKLENWYNNKFLPQDIVSNMRKHWEKQKTGSIVKIIGKNFKDQITLKTDNLQQLEKEWQELYFQLIEKEEEIRKEERELKKILAEFVEICKARKKKRKE